MNYKIKKFSALFVLVFLQLNIFAAAETFFSAGTKAYEAGQFELAAQSFSESLAAQPAAGTLINLGLANWRSGHNGEAILAWEQASWLNPFAEAANENLSYARETVFINPPDLNWFEQTSTWLPANVWTWLAGGSLWLAVGFLTLPGFFRRRKTGWHQTVAALAFGVCLLSLAPSAGIITRSKIAIVIDKNASLKLTPTQSAEIISSLPAGEAVRELRRRGNYFFVHTQTGDGWIEGREIKFICPR